MRWSSNLGWLVVATEQSAAGGGDGPEEYDLVCW